jgi:hypothetical protein
MLTFERPPLEVDTMILFPDHDDPLQWYYSAAMPKVVTGAGRRPVFDLWIYSEDLVQDLFSGTRIPDEMGGGFLTLAVSCSREESELKKARKAIGDAMVIDDEARIKLAPIPYVSGATRIIALDALTFPPGAPDPAAADPNAGRPRFVTGVVGASSPALLGDLQSLFSLSLSERGAAFMAGLFQSTGTPIGVVYELSFEGLSPAINVTVTADLSTVRTHFGGGLDGQVAWFKADVKAALDELIKKQVVKIDVTRLIDTDAAKEAEKQAIAMFKEDLIQQLFRPTPPVPPRPDPGQGAVAAVTALAQTAGGAAVGSVAGPGGSVAGAMVANSSIGLTLKFGHETQHLTGFYDYTARMPVTRTDAPQAFLQTLINPADAASHTQVMNLGTASRFFDRLEAIVSLPDDETFTTLNLRQAVVSVTYGEGEAGRAPEAKPPLVCTPGGERFRRLAFLRNGRQSLSLSYDISYDFDDDPDTTVDAHSYTTPKQLTTTKSIAINPIADFGYRRLVLRPGRIPAGIVAVEVAADFASGAGFLASRRFRLLAPFSRPISEVAPDGADWPIRTASRATGTFRLGFSYLFEDGTRFTPPPVLAETPFHSIDAPFEGVRHLKLEPNVVSPAVDEIDVEVEYSDTEAGYNRRFFLRIVPPFDSAAIQWPILDIDKQMLKIRTTVREGGITSQTEWEETEEQSVVVGADAARSDVLKVRLLGGGLDAFDLDAVLIDIRAPDENGVEALTELFFGPGDPMTVDVTLVRRPGVPASFRFRTHAFRKSGEERVSDWVTRTDTMGLILPLVTL